MEIGHYEEADGDGDDTVELNAVVVGDAMGDVFGDGAMKNNHKSTSNKYNKTNKESA